MLDARSIEKAIVEESAKLIERFNSYHNNLHVDWTRNKKRFPSIGPKEVLRPNYWLVDPKFDPFYCKHKAKAIARSIARKIKLGTYAPHAPHARVIPKSSGGTRTLHIYQIPDAAVSRIVYSRLLAKNKHRFSSFAYAYRDDRNVHFAIQDMYVDLAKRDRAFIAEFDFSDFFGKIDHAYLLSELRNHGLLLSDQDLRVIKAFIAGRDGIPQGTSVSLFLANVACFELDRELERLGVKFARYADDTVICSPSYEATCAAVQALFNFSEKSTVPINFKKSAGIHLISSQPQNAEIRAKSSFDFLGYAVAPGKLSIKNSSVLKIKKEVSYLLYRNLIQPLKVPALAGISIPSGGKDEGLLTAMMQVRRYICGGLYKTTLRRYTFGHSGQLRFRGAMSFYPLVDDIGQLKALDGWLVSTIHRALQLRVRLLATHGFTRRAVFPFNVPRNDLVEDFDKYHVHGKPLLEIPSFVVVQAAMQHGLREHGIQHVMNSRSDAYKY
jgi:RNA-directed DNA polymerase